MQTGPCSFKTKTKALGSRCDLGGVTCLGQAFDYLSVVSKRAEGCKAEIRQIYMNKFAHSRPEKFNCI